MNFPLPFSGIDSNGSTGFAKKLFVAESHGGSGQYSASPVIANGHLYLASEPGQITVVKAADKLDIGQKHLSKGCRMIKGKPKVSAPS